MFHVPVTAAHTEMVITTFGLFAGNLALKKEKKEASTEKRIDDLEYVAKKVVTEDLAKINEVVQEKVLKQREAKDDTP